MKVIPSNRNISSKLVTYTNSKGMKIASYIDSMGGIREKPFIIIVPGYAETKKDYISTSYYLVANGFNVIRYDHTCHTGESDGDIIDTNPQLIMDDLSATLDYVEQIFRRRTVAVVAASVAARFAFRVAAKDSRIQLLVSLVGVVDLQRTLASVYREDIVQKYKDERRWVSLDIFGHEVRGEFLKLLLEEKLQDLPSTIDDIKKVDIPITFLAAQNDAWVNIQDIKTCLKISKNPKSELIEIFGAMHQIQENPRLAQEVICNIVLSCLRSYAGRVTRQEQIVKPAIREISSQNKIELDRLRTRTTHTKGSEREFWSKYLTRYSVIIRSVDYQNFIESTVRALGGIQDGDKILDAGCGNGHLGVWILLKHIGIGDKGPVFKEEGGQRSSGGASITYVGLDFTESALLEGRHQHTGLLSRANSNGTRTNPRNFLSYYVLADLEEDIPFKEGQFDKVYCNLVVSYLNQSLRVARELMRVVRVGGNVVVSSLKPYCDLSLIYRDYADSIRTETELLEARSLLSASGLIRQKENEGHYHFFTETELTGLIAAAGATEIKLFRSFGNQANVVVATKNKITSC